MSTPAFLPHRILVVDDEPLVCDAVKLMLGFDGHEVETAGNGEQALALFAQGHFDIVMTDFEMPGMKGDALAAAIKARAPRQPIVMITAHADMLKTSGRSLPGVDYIVSKPFLLDHLREAIAKVMSGVPPKENAP
jgi:CheY-like chemotaxis protein